MVIFLDKWRPFTLTRVVTGNSAWSVATRVRPMATALPFTVGLFHDGIRPAVSRHCVRKQIADAKFILVF